MALPGLELSSAHEWLAHDPVLQENAALAPFWRQPIRDRALAPPR